MKSFSNYRKWEVYELHPKSIVRDVKKLGSNLLLVEGELILEKPDNIPDYFKELIITSKRRVIAHLEGTLPANQISIDQTIEKLFRYWRDIPQPGTEVIQAWVDREPETFDLLSALSIELAENGWSDVNESFIPYETEKSKELAERLYTKAIDWKKRGATS